MLIHSLIKNFDSNNVHINLIFIYFYIKKIFVQIHEMSTKYRIDYTIENIPNIINKNGFVKILCKDGDNLIPVFSKYFESEYNISDKKQIMSSITGITVVLCPGCIYDCPGQRDHMGPNGCISDYYYY